MPMTFMIPFFPFRKAGFESLKRGDNEKKDAKNSTYGSWGPVFQSKNNFAQMHFC